jgi:hypothetical protein
MRFIRQTKTFDCGVAVAAMIGNMPYEAVLDRLITGLSSETTLSELVMWRTLQDMTQMEWEINEFPSPRPRVRDFSFSESPMAALIERRDSSRHYIAAFGRSIYDPLFDRSIPQHEYRDGNSEVITVFVEKALATAPSAAPDLCREPGSFQGFED